MTFENGKTDQDATATETKVVSETDEFEKEFERLAEAKDAEEMPEIGDEDDAPSPDPEPAPKQEPDPEPAPADKDDAPAGDEKKVDPWANVPDSVKQEHENLKVKNDKLEQKYRSERGRFEARERQAAEDHANKLAAAKAANPDKGEKTDVFKDVREDYPEVIDPLEKAFAEKDVAIEELRAEVDVLKGTNKERDALNEQQILTEVHPNWLESIEHPDFAEWVAKQPDFIRNVIDKNYDGIVDSKAALRVINIFENDHNISYEPPADDEDNGDNESDETDDNPPSDKTNITGKRNLQKKSAGAPSSKSVGSTSTGPRDEYGESFDHYAAKTDKANASSR